MQIDAKEDIRRRMAEYQRERREFWKKYNRLCPTIVPPEGRDEPQETALPACDPARCGKHSQYSCALELMRNYDLWAERWGGTEGLDQLIHEILTADHERAAHGVKIIHSRI